MSEEFTDFDELYETNTHKLEECGHKFHTTCIINWFRQGNQNCPNCGDCGISAKSRKYGFSRNWGGVNQNYVKNSRHYALIQNVRTLLRSLKNPLQKFQKWKASIKSY